MCVWVIVVSECELDHEPWGHFVHLHGDMPTDRPGGLGQAKNNPGGYFGAFQFCFGVFRFGNERDCSIFSGRIGGVCWLAFFLFQFIHLGLGKRVRYCFCVIIITASHP